MPECLALHMIPNLQGWRPLPWNWNVQTSNITSLRVWKLTLYYGELHWNGWCVTSPALVEKAVWLTMCCHTLDLFQLLKGVPDELIYSQVPSHMQGNNNQCCKAQGNNEVHKVAWRETKFLDIESKTWLCREAESRTLRMKGGNMTPDRCINWQHVSI